MEITDKEAKSMLNEVGDALLTFDVHCKDCQMYNIASMHKN